MESGGALGPEIPAFVTVARCQTIRQEDLLDSVKKLTKQIEVFLL